ncbi:MAG: TonB-dependent receptor, partial [Nannocystaceae bacterium]
TYDAGEYEFVFPMVIGPRYSPGDGSVPDAARITPSVVGHGVRTGHDVSIEVDVQAGAPIVSWTAPTHEVDTRPHDEGLRVSLADRDEVPNRDFVLRYRVAGPSPRAAVLLDGSRADRGGHYLMVVYPPDEDVDAVVGRREVIMVIDRSGSMSGEPLALAKHATRELLARLRPVDTFDVVAFADGTTRLFGTPRPANTQNLALALTFVDDMYGGGGTEMADAVEAALADEVAPGFNRYVLFLTDGFVGNEAGIFAGARDLVLRMAERGNVARVFGIGIGSAPNRYLIDGLSTAGNGVPRNISQREDPSRVVSALMNDIDHPVITDVRLAEGSPLQGEHYPATPVDLLVSQPVVVMGRYRGLVGDTVMLHGRRGDEPVSIEAQVVRTRGARPLYSVLWARAKVEELSARLWYGHDPEAIEQITRLGLEHRIVTPYTSFVAVDRSRTVGDGDPQRVEQPGELAEGVDPEASGAPILPGTVPPAEDDGTVRQMVVKAHPVQRSASVGRTISMEEYRNIPVGHSTSRDFTQVVESSATASMDSAGISLAGSTGAESRYVVDGANVNNPAFGTVGASIVQDFVERVELVEAGYDAEHGGATGAQVFVDRVRGSNRFRGSARFTVSPRLGQPRTIASTDAAARTIEVPELAVQGVITASGPIIEDRLLWSAGVSVSGARSSLRQSYHGTTRFADQSFETGGVEAGYQLGLEWLINPRHRLRLSMGGSPRFVRRSYRGPASDPFDPTASLQPQGGRALVANGLPNGQLGWDRSHDLTSALRYVGRLFDDRIEAEATLAYSEFFDQTAWRLDDPRQRERPATQRVSNEGESLLEVLDQEGTVDRVAGVVGACGGSAGGLACPVHSWRSGGIGQYGTDRSRRAEGSAALTHFLVAAGSHQLKYGVAFEHLQRRRVARYSGSNARDFYGNCDALGLGGDGGEWCFDPATRDYVVADGERVDNHRYLVVDGASPDRVESFGFGRVRKELGQLRAIATAEGAGARVPGYDETLSANSYASFVQDKWSLMSNLLISAGVRWELQDLRDVLGDRAVLIGDSVAPRLGVVYDWTDEGRSRLYASYGWFFQPVPMQLGARTFGGLVNVRRSYRDSQCRGQQVTIDGETFARSEGGQPTEWCPDVAENTTGTLGGAVVPRLRGQYDQQLQLGYDHEVVEDLVLGVRWLHTDMRRAVEDVSTNGGRDFILANPGVAVDREHIARQQADCERLEGQLAMLAADAPQRAETAHELQRCRFLADAYQQLDRMFERPRRRYDALSFELRKRFARDWLLQGSYTYSRLIGNFDGFVDPLTAAINPGASVQYDLPELVRNSFGPLSSDAPHRLRLDGAYILSLQEYGRLTLGSSLRVASGYPISLRGGHEQYAGTPVYVLPRGAGGRVQPRVGWNLSLAYAYALPGNLELEAGVRIVNVTNAKAVLRVDEIYSYQNTRPVAGGELSDLKHTKIQNGSDPRAFFQRTVLARQGNYGVETAFQIPLSASFDLQLRF